MSITYSVTLDKLIKEFKLNEFYVPSEAVSTEIKITSTDVNRPGLQLNGFFDFFDRSRIQIIGKSEMAFLQKFKDDEIAAKVDKYFSYKPPLIIISTSLEPLPQMLESAKKYGIPLYGTSEKTSSFMSGLISTLNVDLAPRQTCHGVLVEVLK